MAISIFSYVDQWGLAWHQCWHFLAQPACSKHKKSSRKATPSPSGNDRLDQISRQKWPSTLNNSDWETSGTILTSLQQGEWITSRLSTPSPHSTKTEVPEVFMSRVIPTSSITPLWSVHHNMGVFSRWWWRRSNYGITKYHNLPVRLVGQSQFPPSLSPTYTVSRSSVSGVSLNGKHEKFKLGLEQVFDLVGFQLAWKRVRSDQP